MHRSPRAITSATTEVSGASDILSSLHVRVGDSWRQDCLTCAQHHSSFFNYRKKKEANIALRPQRERFLLLVDWIFLKSSRRWRSIGMMGNAFVPADTRQLAVPVT